MDVYYEHRVSYNKVTGKWKLIEAESDDFVIGAYFDAVTTSSKMGTLEQGQVWKKNNGERVWVMNNPDGTQQLRPLM